MKKLFSLILVALISSQMWAYVRVSVSDATGMGGINSVTGYYFIDDHTLTDPPILTTVGNTKRNAYTLSCSSVNTSLRYYTYDGGATQNKVYIVTINLKDNYELTIFKHASYTEVGSASLVASTKSSCWHRDGNTIYFKVYHSSNSTNNVNVTLNATIKSTAPTTYSITYNKGTYGSGTQIAQGTKTKDVAFTLSSSTYTRTGYTQTGWSTSDGGSKTYNLGASYTGNAALNLYPYWTAKTYTADNNINGNGGNNGKYTATYDATSLTINTAPTREGHTLEGLYKEAGCTNKIANASGSLMANTAYTNSSSKWTNDGNVTLYAKWTANTYTIRFIVDGTPIQTLSVDYKETPICTASVSKTGDKYYTYEFAGWDANDDGVVDQVVAATGDQDYVAVFNKISTGVIPPHNITVDAYSNGIVTLTANGDVQVVPTTGGVYSYDEGTTIIVKAVANRGWHFTQWNDANTSKNRQISEIAADITLTPTFATNVPFDMYDTWTQADCSSNYNFDDYLTVTLVGRTFTAGQWATLSVPFTTTLTADDALYNAIYKFNNVTLSAGGSSVFLEFVRTNDIEKNQPYLVVPRQAINEVVFDGVKLETPAQQAPTTDDRVAFVSTLWQQEISGPNDFYIGKLSTLYYAPNSGMTIKGNRAFFRKIGDAASAPRRAIMVIDGEEIEVEIAGDAIEEVQDVRKYMENGILIIERNGVRMDAQGKRIN